MIQSGYKVGFVIYPCESRESADHLWGSFSAETKRHLELLYAHRAQGLPDFGYGGNLKVILREVLARKFDHLVICGSKDVVNDDIKCLIENIADQPDSVVLASGDKGNGPTNKCLNIILGMDLSNFASPIRGIPVNLLEMIPFESNSDDEQFDLELLIQLRALGVKFTEVNKCAGVLRESRATNVFSVLTAIKYRLHQLHVIRTGKYILQHKVKYTFKASPYSSHTQIIDMIETGQKVLDIGCSQGLLAEPLKKKGVSVTGIDVIPKEFVSKLLDEYHKHDIYKLSELELGQKYDCLVFADVIEHLTTPLDILGEAKKYLSPSGKLIASTPNIAVWFYRISLLIGRFEYGPRGILDDTHVRLYTRATFRRLIEKAGFKIKREAYTGLPFEIIFESTGKSPFIKGLAWLYYRLVKIWPTMFAYQFIMEAVPTSLEIKSEQS